MIEYYKAIGKATDLPLIVQTQGDMSVDLVVEMAKQIPTMKCVKDEAGNPLARVAQIRERTNDKLAVFSGNGVRTMIDEMRLGFSGHCPTTVLSDFYAAAFDLWHAGKRREAFDMFGRLQAFNTITGAGNYLMVVRGVFKENTKTRGGGMAAERRRWRRWPRRSGRGSRAGRGRQAGRPRCVGPVHEAPSARIARALEGRDRIHRPTGRTGHAQWVHRQQIRPAAALGRSFAQRIQVGIVDQGHSQRHQRHLVNRLVHAFDSRRPHVLHDVAAEDRRPALAQPLHA